jgi:hypothetical protein
MTASHGDLGDAFPERPVLVIDVVGIPGILELFVGFEETTLVEQENSSPTSFPG